MLARHPPPHPSPETLGGQRGHGHRDDALRHTAPHECSRRPPRHSEHRTGPHLGVGIGSGASSHQTQGLQKTAPTPGAALLERMTHGIHARIAVMTRGQTHTTLRCLHPRSQTTPGCTPGITAMTPVSTPTAHGHDPGVHAHSHRRPRGAHPRPTAMAHGHDPSPHPWPTTMTQGHSHKLSV